VNAIMVPVYETESREKIVMSLNMKCIGDPSIFVLSGTAMFVTVEV